LLNHGHTKWLKKYPTNNFANTFLANTGFTVFMVTRSSSPSFGIGGNELNGNGGTPSLYMTRNSLSYNTLNTVNISSSANATEITTFTHDGTQTAQIYKNGTLQSSNESAAVVSSFAAGHLSIPFQSASSNQAGDLAELIIYDRHLSKSEQQGVEAYLGAKYGSVTGDAVVPNEKQLGFNLKLWLRADDLSAAYTDGETITSWPAAVGFDAIVPSLTLPNGQKAAAPKYIADGVNGRPVVRFDGVNDFLSFEWFNFKDYVFNYVTDRNLQRAPIPIKNLFVEFQDLSDREFYPSIREELNAYARRYVPMSNNNMKYWESHNDLFDFGMAELHHDFALPHNLYSDFHAATPQVYSMPVPFSYGVRRNFITSWDTWDTQFPQLRIQTRKCIAMGYALGGHVMVPWDHSMPYSNPRYYGDPADYQYLFKLVRDNAKFFDGYEDAYITGYDLNDGRYSEPYPITLTGGSEKVSASVRAMPGDAKAPAVIHLVEWDEESPKPLELRIEHSRFFGAREHVIRMIFHDEQPDTNYTVTDHGSYSTVSVPALHTWVCWFTEFVMFKISKIGNLEKSYLLRKPLFFK